MFIVFRFLRVIPNVKVCPPPRGSVGIQGVGGNPSQHGLDILLLVPEIQGSGGIQIPDPGCMHALGLVQGSGVHVGVLAGGC